MPGILAFSFGQPHARYGRFNGNERGAHVAVNAHCGASAGGVGSIWRVTRCRLVCSGRLRVVPSFGSGSFSIDRCVLYCQGFCSGERSGKPPKCFETRNGRFAAIFSSRRHDPGRTRNALRSPGVSCGSVVAVGVMLVMAMRVMSQSSGVSGAAGAGQRVWRCLMLRRKLWSLSHHSQGRWHQCEALASWGSSRSW